MSVIRVKIICPTDVWFASAWDDGRGPEETVAQLNRIAAMRRVMAKYELATEAQYQAYRKSTGEQKS